MAVSSLHEILVELVRKQPELVSELLSQFLGVEIPPSATVQITDPTLNQPVAVAFSADAAVVIVEGKAALLGAIVEVQLATDERKRFSWPYYATAARAKHECSFTVLVIAPDAAVARWAKRPIDLGFGNVFRPQVIDPEQIPRVTDPSDAARDLPMAGLSVAAHGQGEPNMAARIAAATYQAATNLADSEARKLYWFLIHTALSEAAKEIFKMLPETLTWYDENSRRAYNDGAVKGKTGSLLNILAHRDLDVSEDQQRRIRECTDLATLDRWIVRAATVGSVDDLLG
jgi:hypothetical protein